MLYHKILYLILKFPPVRKAQRENNEILSTNSLQPRCEPHTAAELPQYCQDH